jgi:hypothetical protein
MVLFLFNNVIYVFLLFMSIQYIWIVCLCMATQTEVFPCFLLSCKANARVKPAKTGHGPHYSKFLCCSVYCLFCVVLCIVCVYVCIVLLPPGGYPIAVKYIISYHHILHVSRIRVIGQYVSVQQNYVLEIWKSTTCFGLKLIQYQALCRH